MPIVDEIILHGSAAGVRPTLNYICQFQNILVTNTIGAFTHPEFSHSTLYAYQPSHFSKMV